MASWPWWVPWLVYGLMGAVGAGWAWITRGAVLTAPDHPRFTGTPAFDLALGVVLALALAGAMVGLTRALVTRTGWAQRLHLSLRGVLLGLSPRRIMVLAVLSAVAEELFFRGALTPAVGLIPSAALFGVLHVSPRGTYGAWTLWAVLMGLLFGLLFLASGSLLPPMLAHAAINYENMHYICNYDPTPLDIDRLTPHGSRQDPV